MHNIQTTLSEWLETWQRSWVGGIKNLVVCLARSMEQLFEKERKWKLGGS